MPVNAFSAATLFNLGDMGGPSIRSCANSARAIAARAALRTLRTWRAWCLRLASTATSAGPLIPAAAGRHWPQCWDTRPIAYFLREACSPAELRACGATRAAAGIEDYLRKHGHEDPREVSRLQATLYGFLRKHMYPSDAVALYSRRVRELGVVLPDAGAIGRCVKFAKKLRPALAWAIHATLAGAWLTGKRMHDDIVPKCMFGCAHADDDIRHYIQCDRLWVNIAIAAPPRVSSIAARLGILGPAATLPQYQAAAARVAMAKAVQQATRLEPSLHASALRVEADRSTLHAHGRILCPFFTVAAHQFSCSPGEMFGSGWQSAPASAPAPAPAPTPPTASRPTVPPRSAAH